MEVLTPDQSSRLLDPTPLVETGGPDTSTPMTRNEGASPDFDLFFQNIEAAQKHQEAVLREGQEEEDRLIQRQKERLAAVEKLEECQGVLEREIAELKLIRDNELADQDNRRASLRAEQTALESQTQRLRDEKEDVQLSLSGLEDERNSYRKEIARTREQLERERLEMDKALGALRKVYKREEDKLEMEQATSRATLVELQRQVARRKQELQEPLLGSRSAVSTPPSGRKFPVPPSPFSTEPAARMAAVYPEAYTGRQSWTKWLRRFHEDMDLNGWNDVQRLHALRRALRDGPGEEALTDFDQAGDGTFAGLVQVATRICGKLSPDASLSKYKGRAQLKDETLRLYALDLRRLAGEAFGHPSGEAAWYRNELHAHFVNGIRDPELREVVRTAWLPRMTLDELCEIGEYHEQKKLYSQSPSLVVSAVSNDATPVPDTKEELLVKTEGTTVGLEATIETVVKRILGKKKAGNKNKPSTEERTCFKCQVKGHIAKNCPTKQAPEKEEPASKEN